MIGVTCLSNVEFRDPVVGCELFNILRVSEFIHILKGLFVS